MLVAVERTIRIVTGMSTGSPVILYVEIRDRVRDVFENALVCKSSTVLKETTDNNVLIFSIHLLSISAFLCCSIVHLSSFMRTKALSFA